MGLLSDYQQRQPPCWQSAARKGGAAGESARGWLSALREEADHLKVERW